MALEVNLNVERFVSTDYPRVVAAVRLITGNYDGAVQALQDSILGLVSTPPQQAPPDYAAWITVAASKRVRDARHRKVALEHAPQTGFHQQSEDHAPEVLDLEVRAALGALPREQRQVAVLYYLLDQNVDSIATTLGVQSDAVATQLHLARVSLGARLGTAADDD